VRSWNARLQQKLRFCRRGSIARRHKRAWLDDYCLTGKTETKKPEEVMGNPSLGMKRISQAEKRLYFLGQCATRSLLAPMCTSVVEDFPEMQRDIGIEVSQCHIASIPAKDVSRRSCDRLQWLEWMHPIADEEEVNPSPKDLPLSN